MKPRNRRMATWRARYKEFKHWYIPSRANRAFTKLCKKIMAKIVRAEGKEMVKDE